MKKIILLICMVLLCAIVLGGCGVRSNLAHDDDYPRNYPVYLIWGYGGIGRRAGFRFQWGNP